MKYKVGEKIDFNYDFYEYERNVDLVFDHSEELYGTITEVDEDKETYTVKTEVYKHPFVIKEENIISKTSTLEKKLIQQKIKIGELALKVRDALWDDHPTRRAESQKAYELANEELYDAMSEYDDIEDEIVMLNGK